MRGEKLTPSVGTVVLEGGRYFIDAEGKREELHVGLLTDESQLKELVGKEVELLHSDPTPSVIGILAKLVRCYFILCYYPPPPWQEVLRGTIPVIDKDVRTQIADRLLRDGVISKDLHGRII